MVVQQSISGKAFFRVVKKSKNKSLRDDKIKTHKSQRRKISDAPETSQHPNNILHDI